MALTLEDMQAFRASLDSRDPDQNTGILGDVVTDIKRGTQAIPSAITGIGDIIPGALFNATPFDTATEAIGEYTGFEPQRWAEEARQEYSPERQAADIRVEQAEGFLDTAGALLTEPRALAGAVVETLPQMLAGGAIGRGLLAAKAVTSPAVAIGAGEGAISAGQQMESLTTQGADPRTAAIAAAATGAVVGVVGVAGATLAQKMKIADPDLIVAGLSGTRQLGAAPERLARMVDGTIVPSPDDFVRAGVNVAEELAVTPPTKLARAGALGSRMGRGAIQEGILEEAPQSAFESIAANIALGKDMFEGVGEDVATGLLAGGAMGGAFNIRGQATTNAIDPGAAPPTTDEVLNATIAAGFDVILPEGVNAYKSIMEQGGDPVAAATVARAAVTEEFRAKIADLIETKGNGIGRAYSKRLQAMVGDEALTSKEAIDEALAPKSKRDRRFKQSIIDQIHDTAHYKHLPEFSDEAKEQMLAEGDAEAQVAQVAEPVPITPEEQAELVATGIPEEDIVGMSVADAEAMVSGLREITAPEPTQADLIDEVPKTKKEKLAARVAATKARTVPDIQALKGDAQDQAVKGIADLMTGITAKMEASSLANVKSGIKRDIKTASQELKRTLPEYYTAKGHPKKNLPADLKAYLKELPNRIKAGMAAIEKGEKDKGGYILEATRRGGERLASKYGNDKLRVGVNSVIFGNKRLRKAKPIGPVHRATVAAMKKLGSKVDPEGAGYLHDLFEVFHQVSQDYDNQVALTGKAGEDENVGLDFRAEERSREGFDERLDREAAETAREIHGLDREGSKSQRELANQLGELFALIEDVVGRRNLSVAQGGATKKQTKGGRALPAIKAGKATSDQIRFNRMYAEYKADGKIAGGLNPREIRLSNEDQARLEGDYGVETNTIEFDPAKGMPDWAAEGRVPTSLEKKMVAAQNDLHSGVETSPAVLLLDTITQHSMSPLARSIGKRLKTIIKGSDYASQILVRIHPENRSKGKTGALASFKPMRGKGDKAVLSFWKDGQNEIAILHEMMHAVTVGMVSDYNAGNLKGNVKLAMDDLSTIRTLTLDKMKAEFDKKGTLGSVELDHAYNAMTNEVQGLDEFITYAMTDPSLQAWMRTKRAPKGTKFTAKNFWKVFSTKLRVLFNLNEINGKDFDSLLNNYSDSVSALLSEVNYAGERGLDTFSYKPPVKGKRTPTFNVTVDPAKDWHDPKAAEDAADSYKRAQVNAANLRAEQTQRRKQKQEEDIGVEAQINPKRAAIEKTRQRRVEARKTTATKGTDVTRRPDGTRVGANDASPVDALGRRVADSAVRFFTGGDYTSYEQWANDKLDAAGKRIVEFTARDEYVSRTLGKILSKIVDMYGAPAGYRDMMGVYEHTFRGQQNEAHATWNNLLTLTQQEQQGLLDYIVNRDEAQLTANITGENADTQIEKVINTVTALDAMLADRKAEGMVAEKDLEKDLIDFIDLSESGLKVINKTSFKQLRPADGADNIVRFSMPVQIDNVVGVRGKPLDGNVQGKKFYFGNKTATDESYFIEEGADRKVWDELGIVPPAGMPELHYPFEVKNPEATGNTEYVFERRITVKERHERARAQVGEAVFEGSANARAHVVSALTRMMQEWSRSVEGKRIIDSMVETNNSLDNEADKWITKVKPVLLNEDGTPKDIDHRIINIGKDSALNKSRSLRSKLRVPGSWAFIEDTESNRNQFGAMAGHYVAGPVYSSVVDYNDTTPIFNSQIHRAALSFWKRNKTVFSPVAHVNNVTGNVILSYMYDLPLKNILRAKKIVLHGLHSDKWQKAHPLSAENEAMRQEMEDMGIKLAQAETADYDLAAEEKLKDWVGRGISRVGSISRLSEHFTSAELAMSKAGRLAADLYSNQDNVFRLAVYMTHIQDNIDIAGKDGVVGEQIKKDAAHKAEAAFVDYRIHAPYIKAARETAFPFIAWPYRMFPLVMKVILTKPWKAANIMMAVGAINAASYAVLGGDGDEEEDERNLLPDWHKQGIAWMPWVPSTIRMPWGSGDTATFYSMNRAIPLADLDAIGGSGLPSILTPGGPAFILTYALNGFDPFTGKELSTGAEDLSGMLESRAEYLGRALSPGFLTGPVKAYNRLQETGPLGAERNFWVEMAKVMGFSVFQMDKPEALFYKDIARKQATRLFNAEISKNWRNELRQKDPDFEAGAQTELELQERLLERLQELANAT